MELRWACSVIAKTYFSEPYRFPAVDLNNPEKEVDDHEHRHSQIHFTTRVISAVQVPAAGQSVGIISASTTSIVFTVMGMVRRIATTITMVQPTTMVLAFGGGVLALALNWATSA